MSRFRECYLRMKYRQYLAYRTFGIVHIDDKAFHCKRPEFKFPGDWNAL
jgi:hypothetical protein